MAQRVKSKAATATPRTTTPRPLSGYFTGLHATLETAIAFWEGLGTPVALSCALLCREGEYSQLVRKSVDPKQYLHAADFRKDYAAVRYLAKVKGLIDDAILEDEALRSFKAAEDRCASTNLRLTNGSPLHGGVESLIFRLREKIYRILGKLDLGEVVSLCRWGPGATATLKGEQVRPEEKLLEPRLSVTRRLAPLARAIVSADLHWCRARLGNDVEGPCTLLKTEFQLIEYMRVVTVDKDSKTKRTIGAEPTLNTYVQQGIGRTIRQRLRRVGVDLDDQSVNQYWARVAVDLGLATVDLSSASDLISYWLVELLLPPDWFNLLDMARSGYALMPGGDKPISLSKFSSMGNGYTFELESLIFYAIASVVTEEVRAVPAIVSVYGDDIIIPGAAYGRLCEVFQVLGFKVNPEKSFASGMFYESCGEHYFGGANVTPVYQKELLCDLPELVRAANRLYRWAASGVRHVHVDESVASATETCRKYIRQALDVRAYGPHQGSWPDTKLPVVPWGTEGDTGLWVTRVRGYYCPDRGYLCKVVKILPKEVETTSYEALLAITFQRARAKAVEEHPTYYGKPWAPGLLDARVRRACAQVVMPELRNAATVGGVPDDTSFNGVVTLRGDTGYKLVHRWVRPSETRSVTFN